MTRFQKDGLLFDHEIENNAKYLKKQTKLQKQEFQ